MRKNLWSIVDSQLKEGERAQRNIDNNSGGDYRYSST